MTAAASSWHQTSQARSYCYHNHVQTKNSSQIIRSMCYFCLRIINQQRPTLIHVSFTLHWSCINELSALHQFLYHADFSFSCFSCWTTWRWLPTEVNCLTLFFFSLPKISITWGFMWSRGLEVRTQRREAHRDQRLEHEGEYTVHGLSVFLYESYILIILMILIHYLQGQTKL